MESKTQVAIIGAGITGIGIARDLAQRGIEFILLERGDLASGASGRNHGYLHSGARYVVNDPKLVSIAFGRRYRCSQSHRFHPQDDLQEDP